MEAIISTATQIFTLMTSAYEFLVAQPLIFASLVASFVGGIILIVLAVFRRS